MAKGKDIDVYKNADLDLYVAFREKFKNGNDSERDNLRKKIYDFIELLYADNVYEDDFQWFVDTKFSWESVLKIYYCDYKNWPLPKITGPKPIPVLSPFNNDRRYT